MKAKRVLIIVFCLSLLLPLGTVLGDGCVFIRRPSYTYADVFQPTQKVYIRWDGSQEKLLIQTKYEGPAEEMVWIVPVPSQPTVEKADGAVFQDLSKKTLDPAIDYTGFPGVSMTAWDSFAGGSSRSGGSSDTSVVESCERIGDFEVALLRPLGGEDVIQWLNANGFPVPETINPVLEDYVRAGWWMVAARIAPEALTPITRDKLAQGTLHPLEMTFQSSACLYPMRLTRMAAGPVEELIYIEGPHHYEPATLTGDGWEISLFGGPVRKALPVYYLSDIERAMEIIEGRTRTQTSPCLTKLRRVFAPSEMTDDIIFREFDLARWLANKNLTPPTVLPDQRPGTLKVPPDSPFVRIAQAATQYGRWRDRNGIIPLASVLAPEVLDQVKPAINDCQAWSPDSIRFLSMEGVYAWSIAPTTKDWALYPSCVPLRSCIWALGEIAVEHPLNDAAEEVLLRCAQHDNEFIRLEAYIALAKMPSEKFGPILMDRLAHILQDAPISTPMWSDGQFVMAELDTLIDWIWQFGSADQKTRVLTLLSDLAAKVSIHADYHFIDYQSWAPVAYGYWPVWIVWRAACTQDPRLISVLESRHPPCTDAQADCVPAVLLRAEAACGSPSATATIVRQIINDTNELPATSGGGTIPYTSLDAYYNYNVQPSLRVTMLRKRGLRYELYPMPSDASDRIFRSALPETSASDWGAMYLLARIKHPQSQDQEALMRIWDKQEEAAQVFVVDVLYMWNDERRLLDLYNHPAGLGGARSELAWALAAMVVPEAASLIEEQTRVSWNPQWLSVGRTFVHEDPDSRGFTARNGHDYLSADARRAEQTLWNYFHPTSGVLDPVRLAALQRLTADGTIHAGMRFDLLGMDYGGTDWGLPLLEKAARDILATDSSAGTVQKITSMMKSVGNSGFVIDLAAN